MGILQKMNYREKSYKCGEYVYEYIYPVWQTGRRAGRRKKRKTTPAAQKRLNIRHAREKCARMLDTNFTNADLSVGLSYAEQPSGMEQVKRDWQNFVRKVKRRYKAAGIELKYICVPEVSGRGRYHLHVVMSGGVDRDVIEKLWGHGWSNTKRLQPDEFGLSALAKYITKSAADDEEEQLSKKAYWASKNLVDPEPKISDSRIRSKRMAIDLGEENQEAWKKLWPEYDSILVERWHEDEYGYCYIFARLKKREVQNGKRKRK